MHTYVHTCACTHKHTHSSQKEREHKVRRVVRDLGEDVKGENMIKYFVRKNVFK